MVKTAGKEKLTEHVGIAVQPLKESRIQADTERGCAGIRHHLHRTEKALGICADDTGREGICCGQVSDSAPGGIHVKTAAGIHRLTELGAEQEAKPRCPAFSKAGHSLMQRVLIPAFSPGEMIVNDMIEEECAAAFRIAKISLCDAAFGLKDIQQGKIICRQS